MNNESKRLQIEKATIADDEHNEIIKTMTPQEKAKELVEKFDELLTYKESKTKVKQCALIAVDEIISIKLLWYQKDTKELNYWQEVKQEIEKI